MSPARDAHWTRLLKGTGVEFFMRLNGQTMQGTAASHATYRDLRDIFERHVGSALPPAEIKRERGVSS